MCRDLLSRLLAHPLQHKQPRAGLGRAPRPRPPLPRDTGTGGPARGSPRPAGAAPPPLPLPSRPELLRGRLGPAPPAPGIPAGTAAPPRQVPGEKRSPRGTPAALTSSGGGRWGSFSRPRPWRPAAGAAAGWGGQQPPLGAAAAAAPLPPPPLMPLRPLPLLLPRAPDPDPSPPAAAAPPPLISANCLRGPRPPALPAPSLRRAAPRSAVLPPPQNGGRRRPPPPRPLPLSLPPSASPTWRGSGVSGSARGGRGRRCSAPRLASARLCCAVPGPAPAPPPPPGSGAAPAEGERCDLLAETGKCSRARPRPRAGTAERAQRGRVDGAGRAEQAGQSRQGWAEHGRVDRAGQDRAGRAGQGSSQDGQSRAGEMLLLGAGVPRLEPVPSSALRSTGETRSYWGGSSGDHKDVEGSGASF